MRFKSIHVLLLIVPLAAQFSCSSSDDSSGSNGGSAGFGGTSAQAGASGASRGGGGNGGSNTGGTAAGGRGGGGGSLVGGGAGENSAGAPGVAGEAGASSEAGAGGAAQIALSDAQIVKVVTTLNQGEIAAAQVAEPAAQASAVKNFAQLMITDHTAANGQTFALVSAKHIAPQQSDLSDQLDSESAALLVTLSQTTAANIDSVYIDSQIQMHQEALGLFDNTLLPDATDADLKTLLTSMRATVATHLTDAQTIHDSL
ncbi:MAG TPA: DUF4142 domain-containing protein [Polyangiaceae bacterium]|jgi:putative membrane protein|nr:DUF4142 domain-containing protein [Polyangiaceae bacterium]